MIALQGTEEGRGKMRQRIYAIVATYGAFSIIGDIVIRHLVH
jgi:hypothetical protein